MSNAYLPEGRLLDTAENKAACSSLFALQHAMERTLVLEGRTILCTPEHDLHVKVGSYFGIIPREDVALGIREGTTKEIAILSRVGKPIAFTVESLEYRDGTPLLHLSRRHAQELALQQLQNTPLGTILPATVTHLEPFGAFVDIGCGFISMIGIEHCSVSRISHPNRRFSVGQAIYAIVTGVDAAEGRIFLSHKELLGTWAENVAQFSTGMTVPGYVRGIKEYGTFIELTPNLTGLADPTEGLQEDACVSVFIKAILPERMKIKLLLIQALEPDSAPPPIHYYVTEGQLLHWRYPPTESLRAVETHFLSSSL